jgi:hypothetical protein
LIGALLADKNWFNGTVPLATNLIKILFKNKISKILNPKYLYLLFPILSKSLISISKLSDDSIDDPLKSNCTFYLLYKNDNLFSYDKS